MSKINKRTCTTIPHFRVLESVQKTLMAPNLFFFRERERGILNYYHYFQEYSFPTPKLKQFCPIKAGLLLFFM